MDNWIKCSDRQPKLNDFEYAAKRYIVSYPSYRNELDVTAMVYRRTKVRGKLVERWEWNDRIAANALAEPLFWMEFPKPPSQTEFSQSIDNATEKG